MLPSTDLRRSFAVISSLFFVLGFITCMNDILIPLMKKMFDLNYAQSMLVQFAFFGAYFVTASVYFCYSIYRGDPISKFGYKKAILVSLTVAAAGCLLFYPAAKYEIYGIFLLAFFVLALGFSVLQIAINPYVTILGPTKTAASRLSLSQAFNALATSLAPLVGGFFIFDYFGTPHYDEETEMLLTVVHDFTGLQYVYLTFGVIFIGLLLLVRKTNLPEVIRLNHPPAHRWAIFQHRHMVLGVGAIFAYVGAEVSIGSFLIGFQEELLHFSASKSKTLLAFYWGGAMIGRFLGAISMSRAMRKSQKFLLMLLVGLGLFLFLYCTVQVQSAETIPNLFTFISFLTIQVMAFYWSESKPNKALFIFGLIAAILLLFGILDSSELSVWCFVAVGLFNSIMFPTIFALAIHGLQELTNQASALLIMAILGGAVIPPLQGYIADQWNVHGSFIIPFFCYLYITYYGWKGYKPQQLIQTT